MTTHCRIDDYDLARLYNIAGTSKEAIRLLLDWHDMGIKQAAFEMAGKPAEKSKPLKNKHIRGGVNGKR